MSIPELLSQVEHLVSRRVEAALGPDGPTLDHWRVLTHLADGEGHPMSEIAARAMVPAPTLTKIVDRLVDRALVYRRVDDSDRRRVLVFLSDHGRAEHARFAPAVESVGESLTAELGTDAGILAELLERMRSLPDRA
ncbi:MarR family winged helix-turn-helix transcriptional regulator [Pseudonocardia sp. DSM 110487]|uniref:MarR family winged helix-turn-helix transcriptional regulator n=1 Tax=Pseudonocardia sp. DSM 110487 TaxID=2865833 RepID=UPI001C695E36|nr:MarR family winged helix-turn-helix transcriptional regulator [Pseudonocardia sp. DSM 110487]QYN39395.1 MarR family winged helix-turn-helix transcriptional regulator [Pseudonocardia sp. DSM 110487]